MAADPTLLTAAIVHAPNESVDDVLSSFVQELADDGVRVQGLLQKLRCGAPGGSCSVDLDITIRETYPIFQELGKGSTACRLDPAGVVATNLHADILTDLAAALAGSLGLGATANIDPSRKHPSMFEPIHGSAFDIAGKGIANPLASFWTASLMLDHLGERQAAARLMSALMR